MVQRFRASTGVAWLASACFGTSFTALLIASCGVTPAGPSPALPPPKVVLELPKAGSSHQVGDKLIARVKVVDPNGWRPRSVLVKIGEKKRPTRIHGSVAAETAVEESPGTYRFELSLTVPRWPGEYLAWARASGKPAGAGEETPPQIIDSERVAFRAKGVVEKARTP